MSEKTKHYEIADRAWQPVVGCSPSMPCAPRCWARRTVARIVECQKTESPDRSKFFQIALTDDGKQWSGKVALDEPHLLDPVKWRNPAIIATGFHGDWGRLSDEDKGRMLAVMHICHWHQFMPLTKQPDDLARWADQPKERRNGLWEVLHDARIFPGDQRRAVLAYPSPGSPSRAGIAEGLQRGWRGIAPPNVSIGCSVMNQSEADKMLPHMRRLSELNWRTHVWYEPALGPVDWTGWEFLEILIMGGESRSAGYDARPCDIAWFRNSIAWCRANDVRPFVKQLGADPREGSFKYACEIDSRKGGNPEDWPRDLRVREMPR